MGRLNFMSFGVLGEYGKVFLRFLLVSLYSFKPVLPQSINTFGVFGDDFVHLKRQSLEVYERLNG